MLSHFINVHYCYDFLVNQIPMGLLLYSHLPVALTALLFSVFVLIKAKNLPALLLFATCSTFAIWCAFDLSAWFSFLGSQNTMFTWSLLDFFAVLMFLFAYYFLYAFITKEDLPLWQKIAGFFLLLPTAGVAFSGLNIPMYDLNACIALEDKSFTVFTYGVEALIILFSLLLVIRKYRQSKEGDAKRHVLFSGVGVLVFLSFFFSASFLVSQLAATDASSYVYNYLIYGLFGMPIFLIYLGYLIVRYHAFDLRVFTAQALSIAIVTLVATQYAFLSSISSIILNTVNLILVSIASIYLTRNVRKEIALRKNLEQVNVRLKELDQQKSEFVSFASHQLRSPLTAIKGYASLILDGDYGVITDDLRKAAQIIFDSTKNLAVVVDDYLNVSRIELGEMKYNFIGCDFKILVQEVINELKPNVEKAGLRLHYRVKDGDTNYQVTADKDKLIQVVANIIDNSVKYTPKGEIAVSLESSGNRIRLTVKDTGIGISKDVIPKLFNKFKRAGNANQTNIRGTGLGLFIAKEIVAAHKGKIWAESEGEGRGSEFIVELPKK